MIVPYPTSEMGRNLMVARVHIGKAKLVLMNTHLESLPHEAAERMRQLKFCFQHMLKEDSAEASIIFGGDLNLKDWELNEIGRAPSGIQDVWVATGCRQQFKFTWDMSNNTNLTFTGDLKPRFRFDRLYLRSSTMHRVKPIRFSFVGTKKVSGTESFPSAHWGITTMFIILVSDCIFIFKALLFVKKWPRFKSFLYDALCFRKKRVQL